MIKIQGAIPRHIGVAVSGGVDSMAVLHFLARNHDVTAYCFDHGTDFGAKALEFVAKYCEENRIPLQRGHIANDCPKGVSREEHWRNERYAWLKTFDQTIVLGHHLDDCVETYVFNMCNGTAHHMPYRHANCIRPFRLTRKPELVKWVNKNNVPYLDDPSNENEEFTRNYVRHKVVPTMLKVNPGLHKVVKKQLMEKNLE
jgi:tRNA(Ile)-lysidine synthetase-like protein